MQAVERGARLAAAAEHRTQTHAALPAAAHRDREVVGGGHHGERQEAAHGGGRRQAQRHRQQRQLCGGVGANGRGLPQRRAPTAGSCATCGAKPRAVQPTLMASPIKAM